MRDHTKRLRALERQAAQFGLTVPPHIQIELDEIKAAVQAIEREIAALEGRTPAAQFTGAAWPTPAAERRGVSIDLPHRQTEWDRFAAFANNPAAQSSISHRV